MKPISAIVSHKEPIHLNLKVVPIV